MSNRPWVMPDGSFPIIGSATLKSAIQRFNASGGPPGLKEHIIKRAKELNLASQLPANWWDVMLVPAEVVQDAWWEEALEKQVALKPKEDCKFCHLVSTNTKNEMKSWMMTLCGSCGASRMMHRGHHPHLRDSGNTFFADKRKALWEDCDGFVEPDLTKVQRQLTQVLQTTDE